MVRNTADDGTLPSYCTDSCTNPKIVNLLYSCQKLYFVCQQSTFGALIHNMSLFLHMAVNWLLSIMYPKVFLSEFYRVGPLILALL